MSCRDDHRVDSHDLKPADLLNAWRDAVRAAELAERLASTAVKSAEDAEARALVAAELAALAEQAAAAAARTAAKADAFAAEAAALAQALRNDALPDARHIVESANAAEVDAHSAYNEAGGSTRGKGNQHGPS